MTQAEKNIFFEIVVQHKDVIFNKKTDANSASSKKEMWDTITHQFNSLGLTKRTSDQLKTCYKNASALLKKDLAADKSESFKTGGGSSAKKKVDENHVLLPFILPSVTPQANPFDSSSEFFNESNESFDEDHSGIVTHTIDENVEIEELFEEQDENNPVAALTRVLHQTTDPHHATGSSGTITGNLPARPKLGNRKRKNNVQLKQFVDEQGDLKRKQIECDIIAKKNKSEMYSELTSYYAMKRRILESQNSQITENRDENTI